MIPKLVVKQQDDGFLLLNRPFMQLDASIFSLQHWAQVTEVTDGGRGNAYLVANGEQKCVLRHYRRGGLMAKVAQRGYLYLGLKKTRAWQELRLTMQLHQLGLPVPQPVAAYVWRHGLYYQAALLTKLLPDAQQLSQLQHELSGEEWRELGRLIARFHQAGAYHSDLNAKNILRSQGQWYLIDWDKGAMRPAGVWQQQVLARLQRSLHKLAQAEGRQFNDAHFAELQLGYQQHQQSPTD